MADVARCRCPQDSQGTKCGYNPACPIHGYSAPNPLTPYILNENDRRMLQGMKIALTSSAEIQAVRQAEEDRFGNRPRLEP
jgi:hypothetical protein